LQSRKQHQSHIYYGTMYIPRKRKVEVKVRVLECRIKGFTIKIAT